MKDDILTYSNGVMENQFTTPCESLTERIPKQKRIVYGMPWLDEPTGGILKQDFVGIAAHTGQGKTEICNKIAIENARRGNTVLVFALEAYKGELTNRKLFELTKKHLYAIDNEKAKRFYMREWLRGGYECADFKEADARARDEMVRTERIEYNKKLFIKYREQTEFTVDTFTTTMNQAIIDIKPDLVIVDHLHFFDGLRGETENQAMKNLCTKMRDYSLSKEIPIVAFAHLRKKDRRMISVVPDIDEIHGSSDLVKQLTTCIIFNQFEPQNEEPASNLSSTFFRIGKDRYSSGLSKYMMRACFNSDRGDYYDKYQLYYWSNTSLEPEKVESGRTPMWARNFTHGESL